MNFLVRKEKHVVCMLLTHREAVLGDVRENDLALEG